MNIPPSLEKKVYEFSRPYAPDWVPTITLISYGMKGSTIKIKELL